jgi:hypothetical protein
MEHFHLAKIARAKSGLSARFLLEDKPTMSALNPSWNLTIGKARTGLIKLGAVVTMRRRPIRFTRDRWGA